MPTRITVSAPERLGEVRRFLQDVFQSGDTPNFRPELLGWKYFGRHPWWAGVRSYVLESGDAIAAHGCVTPVRFDGPSGLIESVQVIDWAASRAVPGGGLLIYRHCLSLVETLLAIGGSDDTRRLMPTVKWFRRMPDLELYARPLHPFRAHFQIGKLGPRAMAKTARRLLWSLHPALPPASDWRCTPVKELERVWPPPPGFVRIHRTPEWLNHFLDCPTVRFTALRLDHVGAAGGGAPRGHALLAHAHRQLRIVDFGVDSADEAEWVRAVSSITGWARSVPGVSEIVAGSSLPLFQRIYAAAGMRPRVSLIVYLADPHKRIPLDAEVEINLLIGDTGYSIDPHNPLLC